MIQCLNKIFEDMDISDLAKLNINRIFKKRGLTTDLRIKLMLENKISENSLMKHLIEISEEAFPVIKMGEALEFMYKLNLTFNKIEDNKEEASGS